MIDWSAANPETVKEIVREAEAYLGAQVTLATSADQRAAVMASVFTAAGAAIIAGLITVGHADANIAIYLGGGIAATLFLFGAILCVWATMPVGFSLPGSQPASWEEDIKANTNLNISLGQQAGNYQTKIADNHSTLGRNARKFKSGAIAGIAAPVMGFVVWLAVSLCPVTFS